MNTFKKLAVRYLEFQKYKEFKNNATILGSCIFDRRAHCVNKSRNLNNIIIGENCFIGAQIYTGSVGVINIDAHTYIGDFTRIGAIDSITIGKCVIISNYVRISDNNNHPIDPKERYKMSMSGFHNENWEWDCAAHSPIIIEDNVWIGEFSRICKGVRVGKGSIIAASAVVTKDVPEYTVVAGNPARVVKRLIPLDEDGVFQNE